MLESNYCCPTKRFLPSLPAVHLVYGGLSCIHVVWALDCHREMCCPGHSQPSLDTAIYMYIIRNCVELSYSFPSLSCQRPSLSLYILPSHTCTYLALCTNCMNDIRRCLLLRQRACFFLSFQLLLLWFPFPDVSSYIGPFPIGPTRAIGSTMSVFFWFLAQASARAKHSLSGISVDPLG